MSHNTDQPLFLYLAFQAVHSPAQVPGTDVLHCVLMSQWVITTTDSYVEPYKSRIKDPVRQVFAGMLSAADEGIGNVTRALDTRGILDNTIVVVTTGNFILFTLVLCTCSNGDEDNGGPTETRDGCGARNWPLRGGKHSVWEGGWAHSMLILFRFVTPYSVCGGWLWLLGLALWAMGGW